MSSLFLSPSKTASEHSRASRTEIKCLGKLPAGAAAFTLVEILVACAVLLLLLVLLFSMTNQTTSIIRTASARMDAFQSARTAFDTISHRVSQATMNTYWDYYDSKNVRRTGSNAATFVPSTYGRASDLHFLIQSNTNYGHAIFFVAPDSYSTDTTKDQTQGLLNGIGYYVQYGSDTAYRPAVVSHERYRYRLMQAIQPAENLQVYASGTTSDWVTGMAGSPGVKGAAWPLADNVIAVIFWPRKSALEDPDGDSISANYLYDSRTPPASSGALPIQFAQMPPNLQMTMVVIDEASASRLESGASEPTAIRNALSAKNAQGMDLFTDVLQYEKDLAQLTAALAAAHINYQVFSSTVSLRESKWSQ